MTVFLRNGKFNCSCYLTTIRIRDLRIVRIYFIFKINGNVMYSKGLFVFGQGQYKDRF